MSIVYHYVCNVVVINKRPLKTIKLKSRGVGGKMDWSQKTQHFQILFQNTEVGTVKGHPHTGSDIQWKPAKLCLQLGEFPYHILFPSLSSPNLSFHK